MFWDYLIFDFVKENNSVFIIYVILLFFIFPLEDLVIPNVFGKLYEVIKNKTTYADPTNIIENIKLQNTPGLLSIVVIMYLVSLFAHNVKHYMESFISPRYLQYLRTLLFEGTVNKNQEDYSDVKTGEYMARVMELSRNVRDIFQYMVSQFLPNFIITIILITYLLYHVPSIRLVLIGFFSISIILSAWVSLYIMDMVYEREQFFSRDLSEGIQDKLNNMMNIVTNDDGENAVERNNQLENKNKEMLQKIMQIETYAMFFIQMIAIVAYAVCVFFMYDLLMKKGIRVENMITYMLILGRFVDSMETVNHGIMYTVSYKLGMILAHEDFMTEIFKYSKQETPTETISRGDILFDKISFKYNNQETTGGNNDDDNDNNNYNNNYVFKDFSLSIADGEKVGIVGRSGSGKTTLMKILVGLHQLESGAVLINGKDTKSMNKRALRQHINYINQKTQMFNGDVMHNLQYGNDKSEEEITTILRKYNLETVYDKLPDGIHSDVGVSGGQLSLGMQKVTMLVRGISRDTPVVILDEPLAGLDITTRGKVLKMIMTECASKTLIVITHDKEVLPYMDRIVNMNQLQK